MHSEVRTWWPLWVVLVLVSANACTRQSPPPVGQEWASASVTTGATCECIAGMTVCKMKWCTEFDCDDFAFAFDEQCRAQDIPSWQNTIACDNGVAHVINVVRMAESTEEGDRYCAVEAQSNQTYGCWFEAPGTEPTGIPDAVLALLPWQNCRNVAFWDDGHCPHAGEICFTERPELCETFEQVTGHCVPETPNYPPCENAGNVCTQASDKIWQLCETPEGDNVEMRCCYGADGYPHLVEGDCPVVECSALEGCFPQQDSLTCSDASGDKVVRFCCTEDGEPLETGEGVFQTVPCGSFMCSAPDPAGGNCEWDCPDSRPECGDECGECGVAPPNCDDTISCGSSDEGRWECPASLMCGYEAGKCWSSGGGAISTPC